MTGQGKVNQIEHKNYIVHGLCKCGYYVIGETEIPILKLGSGEVELLHMHFTTLCPKCNALINLVDVSKKPLKRRDEPSTPAGARMGGLQTCAASGSGAQNGLDKAPWGG